MKKIENSFAVTGFIGKDAEIRQFTTASVAKFSLAVGRTETIGEETKRVSTFMAVEVWRKNESASFELLKKEQMITVHGYFKPEEWSDDKGKHNRMVMVATEFFATPEKEEAPAEQKSTSKKAKK